MTNECTVLTSAMNETDYQIKYAKYYSDRMLTAQKHNNKELYRVLSEKFNEVIPELFKASIRQSEILAKESESIMNESEALLNEAKKRIQDFKYGLCLRIV